MGSAAGRLDKLGGEDENTRRQEWLHEQQARSADPLDCINDPAGGAFLLPFLQLFCEGKCAEAQHMMRSSVEVDGNRTSILCMVSEYLVTLVKRLDSGLIPLATASVALLNESVIGPCNENQAFLAKDTCVLDVVNKVRRQPHLLHNLPCFPILFLQV